MSQTAKKYMHLSKFDQDFEPYHEKFHYLFDFRWKGNSYTSAFEISSWCKFRPYADLWKTQSVVKDQKTKTQSQILVVSPYFYKEIAF